MAIADLVRHYLPHIQNYCNTVDHDELARLLDQGYSKQIFRLGFPFFRETVNIPPDQSKRYWTEIFIVRNKFIRVTSQWYDRNRQPFIDYLLSKEIASIGDFDHLADDRGQITPPRRMVPDSRRSNSRYRGNAIGNAQNYFIRNILSNLGSESFSEQDWSATKAYFADRCAYCSNVTTLVIDHAVPINKESLGEHRLGNLVPSCALCNSNKAGRDFRTFLAGDSAAIQRIEAYMDSRNYVPLADNEQMKFILNLAHSEVAALANRYITIINELFPHDQSAAGTSLDETLENPR